MMRTILSVPLFAVVLCAAGCCGSGQPAAYYTYDRFHGQNAQFELHHADHVKRNSDAVRDYLRYRNR